MLVTDVLTAGADGDVGGGSAAKDALGSAAANIATATAFHLIDDRLIGELFEFAFMAPSTQLWAESIGRAFTKRRP